MMPRWVVPAAVAVLAAGIGIAAVLRRPAVAPPDPPAAPEPPPNPARPIRSDPVPATPPKAGRPAPSPPDRPAATKEPAEIPGPLRSWREAILSEKRERLTAAWSTLDKADAMYRDPLMRLAVEDPDPRVRGTTIDFLARRPDPPPEEFFVARLAEDPADTPRERAAHALERLGSELALPVLDRLMGDESTPKMLRQRTARAALLIRRRLNRER